MFAPTYHYFSTNFNANTIQLSVWPWAAYFLVKSLQTNSWKDGAFFGLLGGCALLAKYYSILFLLSCFVAALAHPNRRSYFRSAAPYCAIVAGTVAFAPHAWWALQTGFPTVHYALTKCKYPLWFTTYRAFFTGLAGLALNALGTAILLTALGRRWPAFARRVWQSWMARENAWLVALAFGPLSLTMLLGSAGFVKIGPNFLIPTVYMLPLMVVRSLGPALTLAGVHAITRSAALFMMLALGVSPLIASASVVLGFEARTQVSPEVARVATKVWHEELGTSVRIATGTEELSLAMPFYSPDSPAEFTHYSFSQAPWITPERITREGLLFVCDATDWTCRDKAKNFETPDSKRVTQSFQKDFWGLRGPAIEIVMLMIPPGTK